MKLAGGPTAVRKGIKKTKKNQNTSEADEKAIL